MTEPTEGLLGPRLGSLGARGRCSRLVVSLMLQVRMQNSLNLRWLQIDVEAHSQSELG